jgi:hypothetical protein
MRLPGMYDSQRPRPVRIAGYQLYPEPGNSAASSTLFDHDTRAASTAAEEAERLLPPSCSTTGIREAAEKPSCISQGPRTVPLPNPDRLAPPPRTK